ncbi:MAG: hypothetical protein CBC12_10960 [Candidatus Puniceispirillum sp. TMED52]|nr:MAG: hypothetical protein CBC12_10960 [Candidatus Puniceispirillum sp. TMED52]
MLSIFNRNFFSRILMMCLLAVGLNYAIKHYVIKNYVIKSGLASTQFIMRDHIVIDIKSGVEWLRCSVGQSWDGETCIGKIVKLNHEDIKQAITIANEQLGGNWRLPNVEELEGIVCHECAGAKIDAEAFPNTSAEPYWTGEQNPYATRHYYTVNFFTGDRYGRFFPYQEMAVRLVQDR